MVKEKTERVVLAALVASLIMVMTFLFKIPSLNGQGYIHLGDMMIYLGVLIVGKRDGAMAAGIGSALADIIGGYAAYAIWTLIIKFLMAYVTGVIIEHMLKKEHKHMKVGNIPVYVAVAMLVGGIVMATGYTIVDSIFAGNPMSGLLGIPGNIMQFGTGIVFSLILASALYKTPVRKYFQYKIHE